MLLLLLELTTTTTVRKSCCWWPWRGERMVSDSSVQKALRGQVVQRGGEPHNTHCDFRLRGAQKGGFITAEALHRRQIRRRRRRCRRCGKGHIGMTFLIFFIVVVFCSLRLEQPLVRLLCQRRCNRNQLRLEMLLLRWPSGDAEGPEEVDGAVVVVVVVIVNISGVGMAVKTFIFASRISRSSTNRRRRAMRR